MKKYHFMVDFKLTITKNCDFEKIHCFENELIDGPELVRSRYFLVNPVATKMI